MHSEKNATTSTHRAPRRTRAQWQHLCDQWESSGLSKAEYCRQHGIRYKSFMRWHRTFTLPTAGVTAASAKPKAQAGDTSQCFVPLTLSSAGATPPTRAIPLANELTVELGQATVRLAGRVTSETLSCVFSALSVLAASSHLEDTSC